MANTLTGEFDVVAAFSVAAANRVLAAMHRCERVPHSLTLRVDDDPPPGPKVVRPVVVGSVDAFGDSTVNHDRIRPGPLDAQSAAMDPAYSQLDPLVNAVAVATEDPIVPSRLRGRAQLQVSPPTVDVSDASGSKVTVRIEVMARYFADPQTSPLAEFIVGELRLTLPVDQISSQAANVIELDIKASQVAVDFSTTWSSTPLSAGDAAGINLLIRNALRTAFLPSNTTLPPNIRYLQGKTVLGNPHTLCLLLNMGETRGNPGTFGNTFIGGGDDFGFAVSSDFVRSAFQPTIDKILGLQIPPVTITISTLFHDFHITYSVSLNSVTVDLQPGQIVLTIAGHAHTGTSWMPDFDFTVHQNFTLQVNGSTADLVVGDISVDTSSWVVNLFRDAATGGMAGMRDEALRQSNAADTVRRMLSADANLGGFLDSLLVPANPMHVIGPIAASPTVGLTYTSVEIGPAGIVLHGALAVTDWPQAHVEFEEIPTAVRPTGAITIPHGPDYSALKAWIPGGRILQYEWTLPGQAHPFMTDPHRFVLIAEPPGATTAVAAAATAGTASFVGDVSTGSVFGFAQLCLTVRGTRIAPSGPAVAQPVSATVCGYSTVSVLPVGPALAKAGVAPLVALTRPGAQGQVEIVGHASALLDEAPRGSPNLLVHFADAKSAGRLDVIAHALREARRRDAPTAVVAVAASDQLAKARYTKGAIYAEDSGAWELAYGLKTGGRRPLTLIVGPGGKIAWQHEGEIEPAALASALRTHLVAGPSVRPRMLRTSLRLGRPAPNFLFELSPGRSLTLRKLAGRPVTLAFWRSASRPSIQAVLELQRASKGAAGRGPVLLAINDGDAPDLARRLAAEHGFSATSVIDPKRDISLAYRVNVWPTIVSLDKSGAVEGVRYGHAGDGAASGGKGASR